MATEPDTAGQTDIIEAVRSYLAEQPLEFALLFGSRATGDATDRSDIDIVLKFPSTLDDDERFRRRNRIGGELMARLRSDDVDVSDFDHRSIPVAHAALQDGVPIVGDEEAIEARRRDVAARYERTADDRRADREALLRRIEQGTYGR